MEKTMPFSAGTQVGPYRIMEQLGQGGMATVYKAYHASLDRYVAIKVLHQAFMEDASFHTRFQREARVVAKLEHPNIVPVYDYAEYEGQPYLVMKFIEGETLKARMERSPLPADEIQRVVEAVGSALAYAHRRGVLHRDIKPSNVIWSNDGEIYLADFGLARIAQSGDSSLTSDMVLGTPHYISPEQAMAKKDLDEGTDIYSFGVMLYEMIVGKVPFSADTPFAVIHDHIYSPLPLPSNINPGISPSVERVLLKALAKERADRYKDVPDMVAAFKEAWMAGPSTLPAAVSPEYPKGVAEATAIASPAGGLPPASAASTAIGIRPEAGKPQKSILRSPWLWGAVVVGIGVLLLAGFLGLRMMQNASPTATAQGQADGETVDLADAVLDRAKQQVDQKPKDPRAHFRYGFALIEAGQDKAGYDEVKRGANLAGRNQMLLIGAARAFENKEIWLAALLIYDHIAESLRTMPAELLENMDRVVYYGFEDQDAPTIISYEELDAVDHILGLIAQAHYSLVVVNDDAAARKFIGEIEAEKPGLEETKLLRAELAIDQQNTAEAKTILQDLIGSPDTPEWIKDEATTLLSEIE
jgi:tRNA A-37 threonylcarbamoyl transferase component Bud32